VLIARLIADPETLADRLDRARRELDARGWSVAMAQTVRSGSPAIELLLPQGEPGEVRRVLDYCFSPVDLVVSERAFQVPNLLVSDMDSTMIAVECIDELADFAGIKPQVAAITERAMQGELDFASALRERVGLLADLEESAIARCLAERVTAMPGARTLVRTLRHLGCRTVLVTGGFHSFADPVAEQLGFERVVGNRLASAGGRLTGMLEGEIADSAVKRRVLEQELAALGHDATSLALGDGANDVPMLRAATWGVAYRAKPAARDAAAGWIEQGDLTAVLTLFDIPPDQWVRD
jgi:phosphoserine phosphatase